jgi:hypothetical protein
MIRVKNRRFHPVKGYPNYFVNRRTGEIYSIKSRRFLKSCRNATGYLRVRLFSSGHWYGERFFVHRVVAQTFIKNPDHKPEVNHKDFNIENNCEKNLEWVTSKENKAHRKKYKAFGENAVRKPYNNEEAKRIAGTPF